jgi:hypothetical protein
VALGFDDGAWNDLLVDECLVLIALLLVQIVGLGFDDGVWNDLW